ncbi:MAG: potassium channel family protein [Gemmatimonadota bacterium]
MTASVFRKRLLGVLAFVLILVAVGTVGFLRLPGWNLSDALYMTIITLTAVGYSEVHPLAGPSRLLAALLLVGGITSMGLWFALITSALVEMDLAHTFWTRRIMKNIERLKNHVIVCGAGRTGRQVIKELERSGCPYVVIERDPARLQRIRELDPDMLLIEGDATQDEVLAQAGIKRACGLTAALSADTDNLYVCLSARGLRPDLTIVARAYDEETMEKMYKAGADHVVSPNTTGGIRMASVLLRPQVMSFLDVVTRSGSLSLRLEDVRVPDGSPLLDRTLAEAQIPQKTGLIVIAIRHGEDPGGRSFLYNPGSEERIRSGDVLIVLGEPQQVDSLRRMLLPG